MHTAWQFVICGVRAMVCWMPQVRKLRTCSEPPLRTMNHDRHALDLAFHAEVRAASDANLAILLRFQCAEPWQRALVLREIARRRGESLPVTA